MAYHFDWRFDVPLAARPPRRSWSRMEKAEIVLKTYSPRTTVSAVAREHGIPASLLFEWRKLYRDGALLPNHAFDTNLASQQST